MKIIVLGAGLAGVTTAWYLTGAGHEVTVIDRQPGPGLETSFANGGQISVSHPEPWANPDAPGQILRWLRREDAPLKFRLRADWNQWTWGMRFLLECLPRRTQRNAEAIARLALYSRDKLRELRQKTGIEYDCLTKGILHLFFDAKEISKAEARAANLQSYGMKAHVLDARGCMEVEPALANASITIYGGIYAPEDESGDAHKFVDQLAAIAASSGAKFFYATEITGWDMISGRLFGVQISDKQGRGGTIKGDAVVICLGSYSGRLAAVLGRRLPIYPVKGYSVTLPIADERVAPAVSITDESHRIVCSRLGSRLRVAGTAELIGYDLAINTVRCEAIRRRIEKIFPGVGDATQAEFWAGLRPATPSNVPVIGRGPKDNVFFNAGHGTLGWTLACGSAQAIADIVSGRRPEVAGFPFCGISG